MTRANRNPPGGSYATTGGQSIIPTSSQDPRLLGHDTSGIQLCVGVCVCVCVCVWLITIITADPGLVVGRLWFGDERLNVNMWLRPWRGAVLHDHLQFQLWKKPTYCMRDIPTRFDMVCFWGGERLWQIFPLTDIRVYLWVCS